MKLRDSYYNNETGEIKTIVLVYSNDLVCGLASESTPNVIIEVTKEHLNKYWSKHE